MDRRNKMISFWESLIKGLFSSPASEEKNNTNYKNVTEPDFIDYDGIGNQGRFVKKEKRKRK